MEAVTSGIVWVGNCSLLFVEWYSRQLLTNLIIHSKYSKYFPDSFKIFPPILIGYGELRDQSSLSTIASITCKTRSRLIVQYTRDKCLTPFSHAHQNQVKETRHVYDR